MSKKIILLLLVFLVSGAMVVFAQTSTADENAAYKIGYQQGYERAKVGGPPAWSDDADNLARRVYPDTVDNYLVKRKAFARGFIKGWNDKVNGW